MTGPVNSVAWVLWFMAVAIVPLTSRNPLYLTLVFLVVLAVFFSLPHKDGQASPWRLFAYIGSGVATLSIGFNVLTVHVGDRPFAELPERLPIVGGPLTLNALLYGAISALAIASVLFGAAAFNSAVRHADLVRLLPGSLSRFGVAAGVALLFVPHTIAAGREIFDAQRARGHHFRGPADARAFVVPLLSISLERALLLSEALETRGFGSSAMSQPVRRRAPLFTLGAAACVVLALLALGAGVYGPGVILLAGGAALALAGSSRHTRGTRLHAVAWNSQSLMVAVTSGLAILVLLFGRTVTDLRLTYDTFPSVDAPGFSFAAGSVIVLLALPALVTQR